MESEKFEVPVGNNASTGYGSNLLRLADGTILTSWMVGQADRLARIDLQRGHVEVIKNPRAGLLHAVVESASGDKAWLLCSFALVEVTLNPFAVVRKVTKGLGKYASRLVRIDDGTVGVALRFAKTLALVDLEDLVVTRRIRVDAPDIAVSTPKGTLLLSFAFGTARCVEMSKPTGKSHKIPIAASAILTDRGVAYLPGKYRDSKLPDTAQTGVGPVIADGAIAFLDPVTLESTCRTTEVPIQQLHDVDPDGLIFASNNNAASHGDASSGRTVYLLDPTGQTVIDSAEISGGIYHIATIGPGQAIVSHGIDTTPAAIEAGRSRSHFTILRTV